jgi:c-di-GMP-specific phosphodiesterase
MSFRQQESGIWNPTEALEALGGAGAALWRWSPADDRIRLTGSARELGLGALAPEGSSAALRALVLPSDRAAVEDALQRREPGETISVRLRTRSGQACVWNGLWLEDGETAAGIAALELRFAASDRDGLTGLLERRSFIIRARERLQRGGVHELVVADLDRLARLNEALGHERADLVLAALGSRLTAAFPADALIARIGEDEFAVLVQPQGFEPAEMLRTALEKPLRIAGFDIHPTLSVGAAAAEGGDEAPEATELLRRAELAVESARAAGPGCSAAYGRSMESDGLSRLALEGDLRGALGRGEIVPFYQPVVRFDTGEVSGFEALARWLHPRRGMLSPDEFLPLVEEMGLMADLGHHMVGAAAAQLAAWRRLRPNILGLTVSVNLSTGEIDRPGLVTDIATLLNQHGLPPGAIKLEITESEIMRDPDKAAKVLTALRTAGAGLALDDFGTGFSSLSYLTRLPLDTLKIDRYFVRTMASNEGSATIVRSVVKLGKDLKLEIVAEGVENAVMAQTLLDLGCDYGQGFGYAPALSAQEAEVYLDEALGDGCAPIRARG